MQARKVRALQSTSWRPTQQITWAAIGSCTRTSSMSEWKKLWENSTTTMDTQIIQRETSSLILTLLSISIQRMLSMTRLNCKITSWDSSAATNNLWKLSSLKPVKLERPILLSMKHSHVRSARVTLVCLEANYSSKNLLQKSEHKKFSYFRTNISFKLKKFILNL